MGHVPGAGAGPVPGVRPPGVRRDPVRHVPPQPRHHDGRHGSHHHLDSSPPRLPAIPGKYGMEFKDVTILSCTNLSTFTIYTSGKYSKSTTNRVNPQHHNLLL